MTDRELMQQALDLLDDINQCSLPPTGIPLPAEIDHVMEAFRVRLAQPYPDNFIDALRFHTAIEQPEQEPFCYHDGRNIVGKDYADHSDVFPLYAAPPQRKWQGLTDEEIKEQADLLEGGWISYEGFARAIEAKLKEKNT